MTRAELLQEAERLLEVEPHDMMRLVEFVGDAKKLIRQFLRAEPPRSQEEQSVSIAGDEDSETKD